MIKKITAFFMCLLMLVFCGCGKQQKKVENGIKLYFLSADGSKMAEEERELPQNVNTVNDIMGFAVKELIKGPQTEGNKRALKEGTKLLDTKIEDGLATVNFSSEFDTGSDIEKLWSRYTVINTVCSIDGIKKTQILVEGKTVTSISDGEPLGAVGKDDIVTDESQTSTGTQVITLYFSDSNAMYLVPESRQIQGDEGEKTEMKVIDELIKGPKNSELAPVLDKQIKLLSAETNNGVCYVSFSENIKSWLQGGSSMANLAVFSIVNSLCELDNINSVQILTEGRKTDSLGGIDVSEPLEANSTVLKH